jgi:hypothetical protein
MPNSYISRLKKYLVVKTNNRELCTIHSNLHTSADRYLANPRKDWIPAFAGMTKLLILCNCAKPAYHFLDTGLRRHDGAIHTIKASSNIAITSKRQQYLQYYSFEISRMENKCVFIFFYSQFYRTRKKSPLSP